MENGPDSVGAELPLWRSIAAGLVVVSCLGAVGWLFWSFDLKYSQPARQPEGPDWDPPEVGTIVGNLDVQGVAEGRPVLLHFFNPECPCSRFNTTHLRELATSFGDRVDFVCVVATPDPDEGRRAFDALGLAIPSVADPEGELARLVGVYATPQAVLLDGDRRLVYRGNYNISRYCSDPATEFVRLSLNALIEGRTIDDLAALSQVAYGCEVEVVHSTGEPEGEK